MICKKSKSDKVLKFLSKYINTHGVPRKTYMNQGSIFTSKVGKDLCNTEGIEFVYSPINDHRDTACVERTIGGIKNFVLTYAKEENHGNLDTMVERALGALRLAPNATFKMSPFEAPHGREANTFLHNLNKKHSLQNLNWDEMLRENLLV